MPRGKASGGFKPTLDALFSGERARFLSRGARALPELLAGLISRDFVLETPTSIRYSHRIWGETHLYFVVNASETVRAITAVVAGTGSVELWDPDRGTVTRPRSESCSGEARVHLNLPPLGASSSSCVGRAAAKAAALSQSDRRALSGGSWR